MIDKGLSAYELGWCPTCHCIGTVHVKGTFFKFEKCPTCDGKCFVWKKIETVRYNTYEG